MKFSNSSFLLQEIRTSQKLQKVYLMNVCIWGYQVKPRRFPGDRVEDLPLWTAPRVESSLNNFPMGQGNFRFEQLTLFRPTQDKGVFRDPKAFLSITLGAFELTL